MNKLTLWLASLGKPRAPRAPRPAAHVRMLPAVMATMAAVLGLKAVAMAEDLSNAAPAEHAAADAAQTAAPAEGAAAAEGQAQCAAPSLAEMSGLSQSEVQVLQALSARRQQLDERAESMGTQTDLMAAAEHRLDERLTELRALEATVNGLLGQLDEAQEARLVNLVDVYQRMRAKDAAAVFDGLDDSVMLQVASRMRQANLAEIMGKMEPVRAQRLTTMLAELSRPPADGQDLLNRANANGAANARAPAAAPAPAAQSGR